MLKRIKRRLAFVAQTQHLLKIDELCLRLKTKNQKRQQQSLVRDQCTPAPSKPSCRCCGTRGQKRPQTAFNQLMAAGEIQQQPCQIQTQSATSSANCTSAEESSDEELLQRLKEHNRLATAADIKQCPCRIQNQSPTSSTKCTSAEESSDEELLQQPRKRNRLATTADIKQCSNRIQNQSPTFSAKCTSAEESSDEELLQRLREHNRLATVLARRKAAMKSCCNS